MNYILSEELTTYWQLIQSRLVVGIEQSVLLLEGPPGGGKTAFAKFVAEQLKAPLFRYNGRPDKEYNILYEFDIQGIVTKTGSYVKGPAWQAFEASKEGAVVLLIDEVDKTSRGFDAFLLELIEELQFRSPEEELIKGQAGNMVIFITSNAYRELHPAVLRRCRRVNVQPPNGERLLVVIEDIIDRALALSDGYLITAVAAMNQQAKKAAGLIYKDIERAREGVEPENWATPKEIADFCVDLAFLIGRDEFPSKEVFWALADGRLAKDEAGQKALRKKPLSDLYKFLKGKL